jgi:hypothetical protein
VNVEAAPDARGGTPRFLAGARRQPTAANAWAQFTKALAGALDELEEDEWLVLAKKGSNRFVQFMNQGDSGFRAESVSDFYLGDDERLSECDRRTLLDLGWDAPTRLPDAFGHAPDGSPNYFLDLAPPIPLLELAALAVTTLIRVHGAWHPNELEYSTGSRDRRSIRFPGLRIRRAREC